MYQLEKALSKNKVQFIESYVTNFARYFFVGPLNILDDFTEYPIAKLKNENAIDVGMFLFFSVTEAALCNPKFDQWDEVDFSIFIEYHEGNRRTYSERFCVPLTEEIVKKLYSLVKENKK
jgi:hypothetical protein